MAKLNATTDAALGVLLDGSELERDVLDAPPLVEDTTGASRFAYESAVPDPDDAHPGGYLPPQPALQADGLGKG